MRLRMLTVVLAVTVAACGGSSTPNFNDTGGAPGAAGGASGGGPKVDAATAGELKGTVSLDGMAPKNEAIRMNADPVCLREAKGTQMQETYQVGSDGKSLANVFVYVKDG